MQKLLPRISAKIKKERNWALQVKLSGLDSSKSESKAQVHGSLKEIEFEDADLGRNKEEDFMKNSQVKKSNLRIYAKYAVMIKIL